MVNSKRSSPMCLLKSCHPAGWRFWWNRLAMAFMAGWLECYVSQIVDNTTTRSIKAIFHCISFPWFSFVPFHTFQSVLFFLPANFRAWAWELGLPPLFTHKTQLYNCILSSFPCWLLAMCCHTVATLHCTTLALQKPKLAQLHNFKKYHCSDCLLSFGFI